MTARLASKVVVVTGGSSGIGRAVAERVASEGAAVVIGARRADAGEQVVLNQVLVASSPPTATTTPTRAASWSGSSATAPAG